MSQYVASRNVLGQPRRRRAAFGLESILTAVEDSDVNPRLNAQLGVFFAVAFIIVGLVFWGTSTTRESNLYVDCFKPCPEIEERLWTTNGPQSVVGLILMIVGAVTLAVSVRGLRVRPGRPVSALREDA